VRILHHTECREDPKAEEDFRRTVKALFQIKKSGLKATPKPKRKNSGGAREFARPILFAEAVKVYLRDREPHWSKKTRVLHQNSLVHLAPYFAKRRVSDIGP
jgi:hypothetical protein